MSVERFGEKVTFIWSVADLLRGPYRPPQYGEVMLPLTVLRRLDCVLAQTKPAVLALAENLEQREIRLLGVRAEMAMPDDADPTDRTPVRGRI
jgi:type I restriction enzyme M protein